ncbi:aldo/keto reductase [Cuneatibacter sp. NSJ-177]|uniref:aldo/keto reductase n=1 Tax=Cuneatibacter sp. NSJ-177 TaxID=2931401 RepID=UPI001FD24F23|nr:aldo/keto reductase [Cuneatibacter sp. NSJ-177]MCJ7836916.1 aldo/keto reductase [Cuneatibacter sp. NSJ-177]
MEKRTFAKLGDSVSLLGFGGMRFPLIEGTTEVDISATEEMIDLAMKNGVNYYDTAYPYHGEKAEEILGGILKKYPRDSYFLADKLPLWMLEKEEEVDSYFDEQLRRCGVTYFDYYLVHSMNAERIPKMEEFRTYEKLKARQEKGQIRHLGFSFHDTPEALEKMLAVHPWEFAQIQLNYLDWDLQHADRQYQILEEAGLPVVVMEPLRGGSLTNLGEKGTELLKTARPDQSIASWGIRFAASKPGVMTVLSGMSAMDQVEDNLRTVCNFVPLSEQEESLLQSALMEYKRSGAIPCTGCRYCMECPSGVDIPRVFAIYNAYKISNHGFGLTNSYQLLGKDHQAQNCVECGQCMDHCPQKLSIPDLLKEVKAEVERVEKEMDH